MRNPPRPPASLRDCSRPARCYAAAMRRPPSVASRFLHGWAGRLLAVLALVGQVALGGVVLPDDRPADAGAWIDAVSVLCSTGQPAPGTPAPTHRPPPGALCPLSVALALPAALPAPGGVAPAPSSPQAGAYRPLPQARAPPAPPAGAAWPRGPPVLS
jgi:hypothetical protein